MANDIQGNSHQAISWFLNRNSTSQKQMVWCIQRDEREIYNQEYSTQQDSPSDLMKSNDI